jgi:hypothetical protein
MSVVHDAKNSVGLFTVLLIDKARAKDLYGEAPHPEKKIFENRKLIVRRLRENLASISLHAVATANVSPGWA